MSHESTLLGRARLASHGRLFSTAELAVASLVLQQEGQSDAGLLVGELVPADLQDPSRRVPLSVTLGSLRQAEEALGPVAPFLIGRQLHLSVFGIAGFALLSCATFRDVIQLMRDMWPMFNLRHQIDIRIRPSGNAQLTLKDKFGLGKPCHQFFPMLDLVKIVTLWRDLLGEDMEPERIGWTSAAQAAEMRLTGFSSAQTTVAEDYFIEFPSALLDRKMSQAHPMVHRNMVTMCERTLNELFADPPLVRRIKAQMAQLENGAPTLPDIAQALCMSERTLRRRLQELETSYYRLLDEVRMDIAEDCLSDQSVTTDVIAERLGYAETTNFRHAFRRWTGSSPREYRTQLQA